MALATALVKEGRATPADWADALGAALREHYAAGAPDTDETYYRAALIALERITPIAADDLAQRKADWEEAYRTTPHGAPVCLPD